MTFRFSAISKLFLLIKVIKNLSKVFMQQYNYPKLIWMKQNVSFACSNYRSYWQLIDNFCLHLSEPNRIETRRKRTVNRIVTIEPRCTVFSVNRCTSTTFLFLQQYNEYLFVSGAWLENVDPRGELSSLFTLKIRINLCLFLYITNETSLFFCKLQVGASAGNDSKQTFSVGD